ncbi:protein yippee-like At4g27740, partial [Coffea arabica]|uniref:Protein yippee-like n=1 Tax=Coffea arabica TaxID=13443 RepID=A0A6P6WJE7_COFAR
FGVFFQVKWQASQSRVIPFRYSCCRECCTPVALRDDLLSKNFRAKSGAAYAMNIVLGQKEERQFLSGYFVVADVYCSSCFASLGWKYIRAYDAREKYKEGRFVIEEAKILKEYY